MLVKLAAENYGMKLDGLVAARKISPAVAKRLAAQYIGPSGQELALSLSQGPRGAAHLDGLILALNENTIVPETGERAARKPSSSAIPTRRPRRSGDEASDRVHVRPGGRQAGEVVRSFRLSFRLVSTWN